MERDTAKRVVRFGFASALALPYVATLGIVTAGVAMDIKPETIKLEVDDKLIGFTYDTHKASSCHAGWHPNGSNKDLHFVCFNGNVPYTIIIPNFKP